MTVIVTVIAVAFVGFNVISGAKGYAVTSDSMKDIINIGDIVTIRKSNLATKLVRLKNHSFYDVVNLKFKNN